MSIAKLQMNIAKFRMSINNEVEQIESERVLAHTDQATNSADIESLDQQVKSMMAFSEKANPYGHGRAKICKVCGKEGQTRQIMNHIEANHIAGISVPCGLCGQLFCSRNSLAKHKSLHHRNQ